MTKSLPCKQAVLLNRDATKLAAMLLMLVSLGLNASSVHAAPAYFLQQPLVKLNLEYEKEDEQRTSPTSGDRTEKTDTFIQGLEIAGAGW